MPKLFVVTLLLQACRSLKAERRWAVTGTPLQNRFVHALPFMHVVCVCEGTAAGEAGETLHEVREGFFGAHCQWIWQPHLLLN
jgi:hypothetical protein